MNGTDLLAEFRRNRAEEPFRELVRRYTNLVYSTAKRRVNNGSQAEDATQTVFIKLAKAVPNVRSDAELVAWLHRTTVHAAIDLWRSDSRRRAREEQAAVMQTEPTENPRWNDVAPIVDEALNELNDADRQAVLLRFFEQKSMREVGAALGVSEDAAKMRVSRAMEHLRAGCGKRGAACGAALLGGYLTEHAVEAAPAALLLTLAALQIPAVATVSATAGVASLLARISLSNLAAGVAVIVGLSATVWLTSPRNSHSTEAASRSASALPSTTPAGVLSSATTAQTKSNISETDPIKLLKEVARARNQIRSGEMELEVAVYDSSKGTRETNPVKIKACFDGANRRFESFQREYFFTGNADDTNAYAQANRMSHEQAVQAGLSKSFESHRVTAYDGRILLEYNESDGRPESTQIRDAGEGSPYFVFDPRCLGLSMYLSVDETISRSLDYDHPAATQLVGEDSVAGAAAWHVRVSLNAMDNDYWIEKAHPARLLKRTFNGCTVVSKYDDANASDSIPVETTVTTLHLTSAGQSYSFEKHITRRSAKFNIPVDPSAWTLAGLGMPIGTDVVDCRIQRRIGYWTASGLSEMQPNKSSKPAPAPNHAELIALLNREPFAPAALDAAQWIILNTPDGPEVEQAADAIANFHLENTNLLRLSQELERVRPQSSRRILEALLEKNPSLEVRANACLTLATLRKDEANNGVNAKATAEAQKLFERVISEFGKVRLNGRPMADLAKPELKELLQLTVGNPAPETEGLDLDGQPLRLSDYRGQTVLLIFWGECGGCRPEMSPLLKLLEQFKNKPFSIVGVFCDENLDHGKAIAEELAMPWPSFRDHRSGPISTKWNNPGWPMFDLIDAQGIIRYRNLSHVEAPAAVEALMKN